MGMKRLETAPIRPNKVAGRVAWGKGKVEISSTFFNLKNWARKFWGMSIIHDAAWGGIGGPKNSSGHGVHNEHSVSTYR
jgi:hypothetical protein